MGPLVLFLLPLGAAVLYFAARNAELPALSDFGAAADAISDGAAGAVATVNAAARRVFQLPPQAAPYADAIRVAEQSHELPESLLARVLYQESRFRPEIISGAVKSPAGALGIAQFMPRTAASFGINPLNAPEAIDAAGRYLRQLYDKFGSWADALAAYNWGEGNVRAWKLTGRGARGQQRPRETVNYVGEILQDVES